MDIAEIKDGETLERWLKDRPREDAAAIARRTALRVAPLWFRAMSEDWARKVELTALPILRLFLTLGVAGKMPTPKVSRAANAAAANAAAANAADIWEEIRGDAGLIVDNHDLLAAPLWAITAPVWFDQANSAGMAIWAKDPEVWDFWTRWWDRVHSGKHLPWDLQEKIALIPDEDWEEGPAHIAEMIRGIEQDFIATRNERQAVALLHAALADYSFDALDRVMRMVPFEDDIRHLRDPEQLGRFLDDAATMRDDLALFTKALASEGQMQGAGFVRTYLDGLMAEFDRAADTAHLRVGRIVELGKILETYALDQKTADEFGPAIGALRSHVQSLLDLTRRHFAATMTRMAPLRDIASAPDDNQWTLLQDIQRGIRKLSDSQVTGLPALARDDQSVLMSMSDSIEKLLREHDVVATPQAKSSFRREIDHGLALLAVSVALFVDLAKEEKLGPGKAVESVLTQYKRATGLMGLWELVKSTFGKLT